MSRLYLRLLSETELWQEVLEHIEYLRSKTALPPALSQEAVAWEHLGFIDKASEFYQLCVQLDPEDTAYAACLLTRGCYKTAVDELQRVLRLEPDFQLAWAYLGLAWRLLGDEREYWLNDYDRLVMSFGDLCTKAISLSCGVKNVLNRSFIRINSLIPCVFALPESEIIFRAKVSFDISVPTGYATQQDFLQELKQALHAKHTATREPMQQTLRGGTQTQGNLFAGAMGVIKEARDQIAQAVSDYCLSLPVDKQHSFLKRNKSSFYFSGAWSALLRSGGFHTDYVHDQGWSSSAFYVELPSDLSVGKDSHEGCLQFGQPPQDMGLDLTPRHIIQPKAGRLKKEISVGLPPSLVDES